MTSSGWSETLEDILSDRTDAGSAGPVGELQLLLDMKKISFYDYDERRPSSAWELQIRPRIFYPEVNKVSLTDIKWEDTGRGHGPASHPHLSEDQSWYFSQLTSALNIYGTHQYSQRWIGVKTENARDVWNVLSAHANHRVDLFFGEKPSKSEYIRSQALSMKVRIVDREEGIRLDASLFLGGVSVEDPVFLVGDPVVFGIRTARSELLPAYRDSLGIVAIHPTQRIRAKTFLGLLSKPIDIPKMGIPFFINRWAGELIRDFDVDNQSTVVVLPDRPRIKARITVSNTGENRIRVILGWEYGGKEVPFFAPTLVGEASQARDAHPIRRLSAEEAAIRRGMEEILRDFTPLWQFNHKGGSRALNADVALGGADAVYFVSHLLPRLEVQSEVTVQKDAALNHWVLDPTPPQTGFFVDDDERETDWFDLRVEISVGDHKIALEKILPPLAAKEKYFFLPDGKYFPLDTPFFDRLRDLMRQADSLTDVQNGAFRLTRFQAGWWDELQKLGVIKHQSRRWRNAVEGLSDHASVRILPQPEGFNGSLRDYQAHGYSWMSFLRASGLGGVLADDMGLGKTIQTLAFIVAACRTFENSKPPQPFLIVAPTSVVENWASEIRRFAPALRHVVLRRGERSEFLSRMSEVEAVVTSYSLLGRDEAHFSKIHWDTVIIDEAQFVKNHRSKAYATLRRLRANSKIALTGTPMENNLMELWSVLSIGAPGLFPSPEKFERVFRRPIEKEGRTEALPLLRAYLKPFLLRRTKEKVEKELPPKIEQTLTLPMDPKQRRVYDVYLQRERQRVLGLLRTGGLKKNRFEILTSLTRLRQLCLHASLVDEKNKSVPSAKMEALIEHLRTILDENHKVLIFSQFTSFLSIVQKRLKKEKIRFSYLDGATRDRKKVLDEFTTDQNIPVFLISLKAGGFGLNLTCANYCILLDPWWNPAVENQAVDRTHRIGQKNHVMVYRLIIQDSIEEKVLKLQEKKKALFKNVLEDGDAFSSVVTEEDIRSIFDLAVRDIGGKE